MNSIPMKRVVMLLVFLIMLVFVVACSNSINPAQPQATGNPTPKDYLKNGNADIFLLDGIVYSNVEDVGWVQELDYTIGEEVIEITKQSGKSQDFENGTSNKLPVGTKVYRTDTPVYIAIVDDKEIRYLGMYEG